MAHWIEELTPGKWEFKSALIGFIWLNNAHNGEWLSQALFKIIKWVEIKHKVQYPILSMSSPSTHHSTTKVGHITCDNAGNNLTIMKELAAQLEMTMDKKYN